MKNEVADMAEVVLAINGRDALTSENIMLPCMQMNQLCSQWLPMTDH